MHKIPATVSILTRNSAATLPAALLSVEAFAEIIVADGGSTDETLEIARRFSARITIQDAALKDGEGRLADFAGARNAVLAAATYPWHLYVDSDEYLSPALVEEIRSVVTTCSPGAYWVPRHYVYEGKEIQCSVAYPNQQMRLFHRDAVTGFRKPIHERLELAKNVVPQKLTSVLLVPVEPDMLSARRKTDRYIALEIARQVPITPGKACTFVFFALKALVRYSYRFLKLLTCRGTHMPFAREWEPLRHEVHLAIAAVRAAFSKSSI